MMTYQFSNEELLAAMAYEKQVLENVRGNNHTKLVRETRYRTGFLGELMTTRYLDSIGAAGYKWHPKATGKSDEGHDITLADGRRADVKTGSSLGYQYMMMPHTHWANSQADLFVAAFVNEAERTGELRCVFTRERLAEAGYLKTPDDPGPPQVQCDTWLAHCSQGYNIVALAPAIH